MLRSRLKNKFNKNPTEENKTLHKKRWNANIFEDNRKFWKRIRPLFSDKHKALSKDIILVKDIKVISNKN